MPSLSLPKTTFQSTATGGYALLTLILSVIIIFILIFIPLQLISVLNTRSTTSTANARIAFYGAESAIYDAIARLVHTEYAWPGPDQTIVENLTFSGVDVVRTVTDNPDTTFSIEVVGNYQTITRRLTASANSRSQSASVDVVIVIDNSGSMTSAGGNPPQPITDAKNAAISLVDYMITNNIDASIGVYSFNYYATQRQALTTNLNQAKSAISALNAGGDTNIGDGIYQARLELDNSGRTHALPFIVLLSDGVSRYKGTQGSTVSCGNDPIRHTTCTNNDDPLSAISRAQSAKQQGYAVFTVGLNLLNISTSPGSCSTPPCGTQAVARDTLLQSANSPAHYYEAPNQSELQAIYNAIAVEISRSPSIRIEELK